MGRGRKILLTQTPVLTRTGLINQINTTDYKIAIMITNVALILRFG